MDDHGPRSLLQLYTYEGNITWTRFNVLLVANSIILGAITLLLNGGLLLLPAILVTGGFLLCLLWHRLTVIGFGMAEHYFNAISSFEAQLPEEQRVLTAAGRLSWNPWDVVRCAKTVIWVFFTIYAVHTLWLVFGVLQWTKIAQCLVACGGFSNS